MALIKCTECGHMISDKASKCPKCGCPVQHNTNNLRTPQEETAPSNPYYYEEESSSNKLLYGIIGLLVAALIGLGLWAWQTGMFGGDNQVRQFAIDFANKVSQNQKDSLVAIWPEVVNADSLALTFKADDIDIEPTQKDGQYKVTFGDADILVTKSTDGKITVDETHGLFAYPPSELSFAKKTGQWKEGLTDVEQSVRMADKGFINYLLENFNKKLKSALSITGTGTWGDEYFEGEWIASKGAVFKVKNSSTFDIPGNVWSIIYKEGYWGGGSMATEEVLGIDIKAGETVTVKTKKLGASMESETSQNINVKGITKEEFMASFHPTGNEYDKYAKENSTSQAVGESLEFVVEGLMGGCATRLSMDHDHGSLMYTMNGKELGDGSNENRDVKLVSYNPSTGRLVLRLSHFGGTVTGDLIGIYKNGQYKGVFQNVNGKSSAFSFH